MYEQIYHFHSRPFTATPYVKHYFAGQAIQQSLTQASMCVDRGTGPVVVVGATGTGKSLLLAMLEGQFQSRFNVVNLGCVRLDQRRELLQSLLHELQLPFKDLSETELRFSLIDYLKPSEKCPNGILLLVDEAQALSVDMLDEISLITNFVREGQPRVRLVMAGSQRLEENLNHATLESFNQRIAARCYLGNLNRDETANYVTEHIDRAGGTGSRLFHADSLRAIHDVSDGCPRLINQVCDQALILAATRAEKEITDACIHEAWADVQSFPGSFNPSTSTPVVASGLKNDESWTVIEFGQLDDEHTQSSPGAACEEANANEAPVQEPTSNTHDFQECVQGDPDCEAQQDEALAREPHFAATTGEVGQSEFDGPSIDSESLDEPPLNIDGSAENQSWPETESTRDPLTVADATEMAEQLAGVFGTGLEDENEFNPENAQISDLELEQAQIFEQVELEQNNIFADDQPDEDFVALADLDTGIDIQDPLDRHADYQIGNEAIDDQSHVESESFDYDNVEDHDPAWDRLNSDSLEPASFGADTDQPDQGETKDVRAVEQSTRQPIETIDPFNESFEEEENLYDRYAPFVAHQNQSSLTLTSEDLALLTPEDECLTTDSSATSETDAISTIIINQLEQHAITEVDPAIDVDPGNVDDSEDLHTRNLAHPAADDEDSANPDGDTNSSEMPHWENDSLEEFEAMAVAGADDRSETDDETECTDFGRKQEDQEDDVDPDIRMQAEEILRRLGKSKHVSCETTSDENASDDSPANVPLDSSDAATGKQDLAGESPVSSPQVELVDFEYAQQTAALDESQQILNEILEQRHALAKQREMLEEGRAQLPNEANSGADPHTGDDQEMIVVSRMEERSEPTGFKVEAPVPFPSTPVSTGRAERMDYQKLFDQLREISNSNE